MQASQDSAMGTAVPVCVLPSQLRDPQDIHCCALFEENQFPALPLTQREGCVHALSRLGMAAKVTDEELYARFPAVWAAPMSHVQVCEHICEIIRAAVIYPVFHVIPHTL